MNKIILELVRGGVRPVVTVLFAAATTYFTGYDLVVNHVSVPLWYQVMVGGVIGWWFFDRSKTDKKNGS